MNCLHPFTLKKTDKQYFKEEQQYRLGLLPFPPTRYQVVPCGKCELCLSNKRQQWWFRLWNELRGSSSAHFITLTYNDKHLPKDGRVNKKHTDDFLKRFRKGIEPNKIRYFLVSEYGEDFGRPHYHMLLFNFPDNINLREYLKKTWQLSDPGQFDYPDAVGDVNAASINYVCKYCLSTLNSDDPDEKTFMSASRRPGIGLNYLTPAMVEYLKNHSDGRAFTNGRFYALPRYYRDKVFDENEKCKLKSLYQYEYQQYLEKCFESCNNSFGVRHSVVQSQQDARVASKIRSNLKNGFKK
jgi:hypothetical protein